MLREREWHRCGMGVALFAAGMDAYVAPRSSACGIGLERAVATMDRSIIALHPRISGEPSAVTSQRLGWIRSANLILVQPISCPGEDQHVFMAVREHLSLDRVRVRLDPDERVDQIPARVL